MKSSFVQETFPEDVAEAGKNPFFLDIRQMPEFTDEHIDGARNIPLREIRNRYGELNMDQTYYVYCTTGIRSASAVFLLNSNGFNAVSLKGGISAWPGPVVSRSAGIHDPAKPT